MSSLALPLAYLSTGGLGAALASGAGRWLAVVLLAHALLVLVLRHRTSRS